MTKGRSNSTDKDVLATRKGLTAEQRDGGREATDSHFSVRENEKERKKGR